MVDFRFYLNKQGPKGAPGNKGEQGFSPEITVDTNTAAEYKLRITTETDSFVTDNLRGSAVTDMGGTYMRYNPTTQAMYAGFADVASENQAGMVQLAADGDIDAGTSGVVPTAEQVKEALDEVGATVGNGTITINQNGVLKGEFTVNQSGDATINLSDTQVTVDSALSSTSTNPVQNKVIKSALDNKANVSDIPDVSGFATKSELQAVEAEIPDVSDFLTEADVSDVAISGSYNDLLNKPTIPAAANNGTLTITQSNQTLGTFTADSSSNVTINIPDSGSTYTAGDGISISNDVISAKVDGTTIDVDSSGNLTVIGGGSSEIDDTTTSTTTTYSSSKIEEVVQIGDASTMQTVAENYVLPTNIIAGNNITITRGTTTSGGVTVPTVTIDSTGGTISGDVDIEGINEDEIVGNITFGINNLTNSGLRGYIEKGFSTLSTNNPFAIQFEFSTSNTSCSGGGTTKCLMQISHTNYWMYSSTGNGNVSVWNGSSSINLGTMTYPTVNQRAIWRFEYNGTTLTGKAKLSTDASFTTKFSATLPSTFSISDMGINLLGLPSDNQGIAGCIYYKNTFVEDMTTGEKLWQPKIVIS